MPDIELKPCNCDSQMSVQEQKVTVEGGDVWRWTLCVSCKRSIPVLSGADANRARWNLTMENEQLRDEIAVDNQLLEDRQRILDALPCPVHGACVPYVVEWITKQRARMAEAVKMLDAIQWHTDDSGAANFGPDAADKLRSLLTEE